MGLYETLHFTAKASVQITTQGTRGDPGVVKTLGTTVGLPPQGWWLQGPEHGTGQLPPNKRHRKLTPEKHTDQRKDGGNCWVVTWQRRWSSTSRARVQAAKAGTQPTLPAVELLELTDPRQPMPTTTYVYRPHLTASPATKFKPQSKLEFTQAGPQGLEGPAPHNHPELSDARRTSQASEDPGTGLPVGQTSSLGPQMPREPRRGQTGPTCPREEHEQTQVETCRTEQGTTHAETVTGWEGCADRTRARCQAH